MSSMRNAVQRRNHKERAQPLERQKWGLLEKHKDYSLRAKDHNQKKRKLKALQEKASERNEDEFYFGMMRNQTHNGTRVAKRGEENSGGGGKTLSMDVVKLMKTQDVAYLRTALQSTRKEREGLEKEVTAAGFGVSANAPAKSSGRIVFDENGEAPAYPSPPEDDMLSDFDDGEPESEDEAEDKQPVSKAERTARKRKRHALDVKKGHLESLRDREEQLSTALREVEDQRARMSGSVGGVNKNGTKFKLRERKR